MLMNDIVERLEQAGKLTDEAADEIERLNRLLSDMTQLHNLREARLAEAQRLLRDCYSPVRRIAEGGSRTREDLERAEDTFARLKEFLS